MFAKAKYWNADDADFNGLVRIFCFEPHRSIVFFDCVKGASLRIVYLSLFAKAKYWNTDDADFNGLTRIFILNHIGA